MDNNELIPVDLTISAEIGQSKLIFDNNTEKVEDSVLLEDGNFSNIQKRRSKNDKEGRNHVCRICTKAYLSYSALYTHMKSKHSTEQNAAKASKKQKDCTNQVSR